MWGDLEQVGLLGERAAAHAQGGPLLGIDEGLELEVPAEEGRAENRERGREPRPRSTAACGRRRPLLRLARHLDPNRVLERVVLLAHGRTVRDVVEERELASRRAQTCQRMASGILSSLLRVMIAAPGELS